MSDLYLYKNTLRDMVRPGKLSAAVLLVVLSLVIALFMRAKAAPGEFDPGAIYNGISSVLVFGYTLVILSVVFATGVIVQEIEQKTIPYLLTRPMPRWRILLAKYLGAVSAITITVWVADAAVALALFGPAKIGASHLWKDILILPIGAMAYSGLFMLLATVVPRALLFGLAYAFVEPLMPLLPGDWQKISLLSYIHRLAPHLDAGDANLGTQALAAADIRPWVAWTVVLSVIALSVVGALIIFSVREYTPQEEKV